MDEPPFKGLTEFEIRLAKELIDMRDEIFRIKMRPMVTLLLGIVFSVVMLIGSNVDAAIIALLGFGFLTFLRILVRKFALEDLANKFYKLFLKGEYAEVIRKMEQRNPGEFDDARELVNEFRDTNL